MTATATTTTVGTTTEGTTTGGTATEGTATDGTTTDGTTTDATGETDDPGTTSEPQPICGNGELEEDEACDDGNLVNTDGCTDTCELAVCGDGYVQEGVEQLNVAA